LGVTGLPPAHVGKAFCTQSDKVGLVDINYNTFFFPPNAKNAIATAANNNNVVELPDDPNRLVLAGVTVLTGVTVCDAVNAVDASAASEEKILNPGPMDVADGPVPAADAAPSCATGCDVTIDGETAADEYDEQSTSLPLPSKQVDVPVAVPQSMPLPFTSKQTGDPCPILELSSAMAKPFQ
jgi:hypothetical protein